MKILHIPHRYRPALGGAEDLSVGLSEGLAARGHEVRVVVADFETPEGLYRFGVRRSGAADETISGVDVRRIDPGVGYRAGNVLYRRAPYSNRPTAVRLRRSTRNRLTAALRLEIAAFAPDVVLTLPHLFENVRSVLTIHGEEPFPLVWMPLLHEEDPNWPLDEIRRRVPSADALVAVTEHEADRLVAGYGADPDRVHVIPPGVVVPAEPPEPESSTPTVLFLGRLTGSKGIEGLARSMQRVWETDPRTRLVIAGATTPETADIEGAVRRGVAEGAAGEIEFERDLTDREKQRRLRSATVLVLPSRVESFGMVLLEAWASAVPVIAFDTPVLRTVVADGVDGVLADPDEAALGDAIAGLVTDPIRARQMGMAGFEKVRSRYSWQAAARELESVYLTVVDGGSGKPDRVP